MHGWQKRPIYKMYSNKRLKVCCGCFLSTSLKVDMLSEPVVSCLKAQDNANYHNHVSFYLAVFEKVWQWSEEEDCSVYKHQCRCEDSNTARQRVCRPAETCQSRILLHQTLPETAQGPVVCLHVARGSWTTVIKYIWFNWTEQKLAYLMCLSWRG